MLQLHLRVILAKLPSHTKNEEGGYDDRFRPPRRRFHHDIERWGKSLEHNFVRAVDEALNEVEASQGPAALVTPLQAKNSFQMA